MGIALVLRASGAVSHFRDALVGAIGIAPGAELLLCSGFFQENPTWRYKLSTEPDFFDGIVNNNINVIAVGCYNEVWRRQYINFVTALRGAGGTVDALSPVHEKWHAKISIIRRNDRPIFGVVGSSNLTGPAFGSLASPGFSGSFNWEADVILWEDSEADVSGFMEEFLSTRMQDVIRAPYIPEMNLGINLVEKLQGLWDDVIANTIPDPDLGPGGDPAPIIQP